MSRPEFLHTVGHMAALFEASRMWNGSTLAVATGVLALAIYPEGIADSTPPYLQEPFTVYAAHLHNDQLKVDVARAFVDVEGVPVPNPQTKRFARHVAELPSFDATAKIGIANIFDDDGLCADTDNSYRRRALEVAGDTIAVLAQGGLSYDVLQKPTSNPHVIRHTLTEVARGVVQHESMTLGGVALAEILPPDHHLQVQH